MQIAMEGNGTVNPRNDTHN